MNTSLAVSFLSGKYDPDYKKAHHLGRILQARLNKPKTTVVKVVSDWAMEEKHKGGRPKRKPQARVYCAQNEPGIMETEGGKFQVQIKHWRKSFYLGVFNTIEEAVRVRDESKAQLTAGTFIYKGQLVVDERQPKPKKSGLPKFVYYSKAKDRYLIQRTVDNKKYAHGTYKTLEEAVNKLKELGYE